MSKVKLEVGKFYEARDPEMCRKVGRPCVIQIVEEYENDFYDKDDRRFLSNGKAIRTYFDLVREVSDPNQKP